MACQLAVHMRGGRDLCHMTRGAFMDAAVRIHGQAPFVPRPQVSPGSCIYPWLTSHPYSMPPLHLLAQLSSVPTFMTTR